MRNALVQVEESLRTALTLIGEAHDVDLTSGKYNVDPEGYLVPVEAE